MKKVNNNLENGAKLTLNKFKISKLDNLISIKGGSVVVAEDDDSEDDTWGN